MHQLIERNNLHQLIDIQAPHVVGIYLPMHHKGPETRQNPIRMKNALRHARDRLQAQGMDAQQAQQLLEPAWPLVEDSHFWQHQGQGLAVILWPGNCTLRRLPFTVPEKITVTPHPVLRPMLPLYQYRSRFYILAISQHEARLLECTPHGVRRMTPDDVPAGMQDLLRHYEEQRSLQFHTGTGPAGAPGRRAAIFHGHGASGSDETLRKQRVLEYFQLVDRGLSQLLHHDDAPLLLACVGWEAALYRQANTYPHLLDDVLEGNHEHLDDHAIYEKARDLLAPHITTARQQALEQFRHARNDQQTAEHLPEIVAAAATGRVQSLLIDADTEQLGTFDPQTLACHLHDGDGAEAGPEQRDLVELAALQTLTHGGQVQILETDQLPAHPAAAVLRYV